MQGGKSAQTRGIKQTCADLCTKKEPRNKSQLLHFYLLEWTVICVVCEY